jgi:hypothetical protein
MRYRSKTKHLILAILMPHQAISRLFLVKGTSLVKDSEEVPDSFSPDFYLLALSKERHRVINFFLFKTPLHLFLFPFKLIVAPYLIFRLILMNQMVACYINEHQLTHLDKLPKEQGPGNESCSCKT